jgi:hypothetical protein
MSTGRLGAGDTAIQPTILDAKADILTATAADTPARLAVGNNGETLVADSSATTGLRWQGNYAAAKNAIINGDFRINQRAFTSTTAGFGYNFDRWTFARTGGSSTISAQTFALGTAPVAGYEGTNFVRCDVSGQTLASHRFLYTQLIESVRTFAGQTITISFWAKASSGTPSVAVSIQQDFGSVGGSGGVQTAAGKVAITTSWARYSVTVAVPSISGKTIGTSNDDHLGIRLWTSAGTDFNTATTSLGLQTATIDFWGVQVEAGSVATAFQTATGTLAGELAACQRYYWRQTGDTTNAPYGTAINVSGNSHSVLVQYPVPMRVTPTAIEFSTLAITDKIAGTWSITALTIDTASSSKFATFLTATAVSGLASRSMCFIVNNSSTAGYLGFTAEL